MVFFRTSTDVAISSSSSSILISGRSRCLSPPLLLLPSLDCTHVYNVHTIHNVYNVRNVRSVYNVHNVHNVNNEYNVYNVRSVHMAIGNANNVNYYPIQCMLLSVSIT